MKKILLYYLLLVSLFSNAQNSFFIDEQGKKTVMRDDSVDLKVVDSQLSYTEVGKTWIKLISFKKLDYAIIGDLYFKSFQLKESNGKKLKKSAYFVITETDEKKLLCFTYSVVGNLTSTNAYYIYVIDNNDNILDYIGCTNEPRFINKRGTITDIINKHFSDCPLLLEKYAKFNTFDTENINLLNFFNHPSYLKCN
jgi:hypothetical protein